MDPIVHGTILRRYVDWITRHPRMIITVILLISAFLASSIPTIHIENERKFQLPQNDPIIQLDNKILSIFGGGKFTIIGVAPVEGDIFQPWFIEKIQKITDAIKAIPGINPGKILSITAPKVKSIEAGEEGEIIVRRLVGKIPLTQEEMDVLRHRIMGEKLFIGYLVAPGGKAASIIADIDELDQRPELRNSVLARRIKETVAPFREPRVNIYLAGVPITISGLDYYTRYVLRLFVLAVIMIGLVHFEAFRTLQAMFLPLVTALLSVVWGLGIFGYLGTPIDGWNSLSPFLILAVAAGHAVQILKRYYEEFRRLGDNRLAVVESTASVGTVMIMAGLIAAAGLLTLTLFPIRSIQIFGFLSASGILSALLIEMTFIPACRTLLPTPKVKEMTLEKHGGLLEKVLEWLAHIIYSMPWLSLLIGAIVIVVMVIGATHIEVDNSFRKAFPKDDPDVLDYEALNALFGGTTTLTILVEGKDQDSLYDPDLLKSMDGLQTFLESQPHIGRTTSIVDYVKQMNAAFNGGDERFLNIPDSREAVAQFFLLYSGDPDDFDMVVDSNYRRAIIRVFARSGTANFCDKLIRMSRAYAAEHFPPGVIVSIGGGDLAISKSINEVVMREKIRNAAVIATIIFLISSLVLRSFVGGFLVLTPSLLAAVVNLGIMGIIGTWLNLATASITSLTVSIGADYSIYFIFRFREEYRRCKDIKEATLTTMLTSGKAIFFVSSAIAAGSLVMALSPLAYHKQLGGYVAISMFTSSLAAVTIIPSLVILFKPKFLQRRGWSKDDSIAGSSGFSKMGSGQSCVRGD